MRTCKGLDKLIYIACNPPAVIDNLLNLTLPENKKSNYRTNPFNDFVLYKARRGPPFKPVKAYGVDLFPLTNHYECVIMLERY